VGGLELVRQPGGLRPQAGQLDQSRRVAVAAGGNRRQARHAVVVRRRRRAAFAGEAGGEVQDFAGVAVIHLEDGGAALGADAHALEAEVALRPVS
jgi:hypothetical protein